MSFFQEKINEIKLSKWSYLAMCLESVLAGVSMGLWLTLSKKTKKAQFQKNFYIRSFSWSLRNALAYTFESISNSHPSPEGAGGYSFSSFHFGVSPQPRRMIFCEKGTYAWFEGQLNTSSMQILLMFEDQVKLPPPIVIVSHLPSAGPYFLFVNQ